jgi:hypothetical protein
VYRANGASARARETCGARRQGWENEPFRGRIPCVRPAQHQGDHRDALSQNWAQDGADDCGLRKPGFDQRPMIGKNSQPCTLPADHEGDHRNALGVRWAAISPERQAAREEFEAQCAADEAELLRLLEWKAIERSLSACYRAQHLGDDSVLTRQRIRRLEALQQCMLGNAGALAG